MSTLFDVPTPERFRIVTEYKGRTVAVSGTLPLDKALKRMRRLQRRLPYERYRLRPVITPAPTNQWRRTRDTRR